MENIILTVHLIIALCLIGIVLIQRSEGGGLGVGGGGGGAATSGRPGITALGKLTWVFGIAFVITSITLTVLAARNANTGSVLDGAVITAPAEGEAPVGDALLPPTLPSSGDAPLAPPRVDE
ncbi:MAG: preprotein translocase subunit SecG [Litoreibacter sp.]|uniref:preprotein translocase subunit SecG n=1 Tax=Litoreibacter sp. TaxID=1969459 RepID=UPI0032996B8D